MRKLKVGLLVAAAFVTIGIMAPAPANAQGPAGKVVICHTPGHQSDNLQLRGQCGLPQSPASEGKIIEIEVSPNACWAHLGHSCNIEG